MLAQLSLEIIAPAEIRIPSTFAACSAFSALMFASAIAPSHTSAATGGEARTVTGVRANFVRAKMISITGGAGSIVQIIG